MNIVNNDFFPLKELRVREGEILKNEIFYEKKIIELNSQKKKLKLSYGFSKFVSSSGKIGNIHLEFVDATSAQKKLRWMIYDPDYTRFTILTPIVDFLEDNKKHSRYLRTLLHRMNQSPFSNAFYQTEFNRLQLNQMEDICHQILMSVRSIKKTASLVTENNKSNIVRN